MDNRIGAQLYTVRDFCKTVKELSVTLERISEIGYKSVQVSGIGPIPAEEIRSAADCYGLSISCTHKSFNEFTENLQAIIKYNQTLGCKIAGIGSMPADCCGNEAKLMDFIKKSNEVAAELSKNGLVFGYHNHSFEFSKINGKYVFDIIRENTDPSVYKFICDTYWLAYGAQDPAKVIESLGDRAAVVHFKDFANEPYKNEIYMAEVMNGNLDWNSIIASCKKAGTQYAIVEQDICKNDPFESLEISYKNLCTKGFC